MDILVNVSNQKLKIVTNLKSIVSGTQEFIRFVFELGNDWDDLTTFAQFKQNGVAYNQYLDTENSVFLPSEITTGTATLVLYGSGEDTIAITDYLTLKIAENIIVEDAESTAITLSLYNQLVKATGDAIRNVQALIGSPLVASTVAEMTDTTKVYVYTGSESGYTNGNWYYYDGTNWTSGGVYNSVALDTDTTLTISNKAADAKAVGDEVSDLKSDLSQMQTATDSDIGKALKAKTVVSGKVTEWEFGETGGSVDPTVIEQVVTDWLDDHPEATTTVTDYSLGYQKLEKGTLGFVTPEMYGAVGDGIADDSTAVQAAVNASNNIYFTNGKTYYLASQVEITNDAELHGNGATIKTATPSGGEVNNGFYVHGILKKTTTITTDYETYNTTANSSNRLTLVDMTDVSIGDLVVITARDQYYAYTRQYYYLGAVLEVVDIYNGCLYVNMSMPWDITLTENVTVDIYDAPSVSFENMNFVSDHGSWGSYNSLIDFEFCKNASVKNCNLTQFVMGIYFRRCINSIIENVRLSKSKYDNAEITNDGYGIAISSCTNTVIKRIISLCSQSCIDLTGDVPNINTYIFESSIASECRATGIGSHENAYNTVIEDCTLGGLSAYGTVFINRCKFFKNNRGPASNAGINYRGSHNADWSRLFVSGCEFDGNMAINILAPDAQNPVQAISSVIEFIDIKDCIGGFLSYIPSTGVNVIANTINTLKMTNWKNCNEIYHLGTNAIKSLIIKDCTFKKPLFLNNHVNADGIVTTGIDLVDVSASSPLTHKVVVDKTTYGEKQALPENVIINFTANAETDQFIICGSNLVSDDVQDYVVGGVSGSTGQSLTRSVATGTNIPTISTDVSGNIVYSQNNNTNKRYLYNKFMFSVDDTSNISVSVKLKNTGETEPSSWTIYAHRVDKYTGLVGGRTNSNSYSATAEGETAVLNYNGVSNSIVLISFYCNTPIENSITTFEELSIVVTPLFNTAPSLTEKFTAKRLTGSGSLVSVNGINNIMTSANTFHVKFGVDYNTLFPNPSAVGVEF